ncbi:hypothetical protein JOF56_001947 [Kibdelosporangium banguiense]|uniref:Fibronectin type-III domain-containing protein n=1 Tax=Kibdelosporangium banguiense TaxID=1365924 RepID=A0ABS4TAW2_9PSEU|nr:fibronectin type III domain-containing protein [Kibdelosporangium banguiense]MBP2321562.1 hypothetical protein [Kibdelosporangium banguiense]
MERRLLQRAGYVAGGLIVVAGAIVALRNADTPTEQKPPLPAPPQTEVVQYADQSVLLPQPGGRPEKPADLVVTPGPHRLQVSWARKPEITGYDVRLRGPGDFQRTRLVADEATQFDGLDDHTEYSLEVRAVDSFGQRSDPVTQTHRPSGKRPDESRYALVDHFDGAVVPDPARWQLANNAACARMSRGADDDNKRLVISAACGAESVAIRSRTPLRLKDNGGELGRMMIETDAPATDGELTMDLVPGPVDLVESGPRGDGLIPGLVRVRITSESVEIPGFPAVKIPRLAAISSRWELVLRTDGISVWRNGVQVAAANVVPTWTEATPLFGFAGPANGLNYAGIDAIGLSSGDTPAYVPAPRITSNAITSPDTEAFAGSLGGQLRITIRASYGVVLAPFTVDIAGRSFPARPATEGQGYQPGTRYPIVVDLPADALLLSGDRHELRAAVHSSVPQSMPVVQHLGLELVPDPAHKPSAAQAEPASEQAQRPRLMIAPIKAALLDAAGNKIDSNHASPRGRVVLDVTMTGADVHAGLAGIEIWVDNKRIAGIPTNRDGPAVTGHWRIALNSGAFPTGVRNLELKAISTDSAIPAQFTSITWQIPA